MPFFKTTKNILKDVDQDELFDQNWFDSSFLQLPPSVPWDYKREIKIEDVDIWEVLYEEGGGRGAYASWNPYAEFYMILNGYENYYFSDCNCFQPIRNIETFYGVGSNYNVQKKMKELGMPFSTNYIWIENKNMWLYNNN